MVSRGRQGIVLGVMALLLFAVAPTTTRARADVAPGARIVSELHIAKGGITTESLELTVPLTAGLKQRLAILRRTSPDSFDAYREQLEDVFRLLASPPETDLRAVFSAIQGAPQLQIADGIATLKLDLLYPMLWTFKDAETLRFDPVRLSPNTRLVVVLHARTAGVDTAAPLPVADDGGGDLRWSFGSGRTPAVDVTLRNSLTGPNSIAGRSVANFLVFLLPLLIFAGLLLFLAPHPWGEGARAALRICAGASVAALSAATYFGIVEWQVIHTDVVFTITRNSSLIEFVKAAVPALGIAAFAATPPISRNKTVARGLLGFGLGMVVALSVTRLHAIYFDPESPISSWPYELAGAVAAAFLLALLLDTTLLWLNRIWAMTGRIAKIRSALLGPIGRLGAIFILVAVAVAQILFVTGVLGSSGEGSAVPVPTFELILAAIPLSICNLLLVLSIPLFSLSVLGWLWQRAANEELPLHSGWEGLVVGLVVATSVIGLIGTIDGYPTPAPFFISLVSLGAALYLLGSGSRADLMRTGITRTQTDRLLDRWLALRQLQKPNPDAMEADGTAEEHRRQRQSLLDSPELADVDEEDREREMLDLGLSGARSATERLGLLADRGWLIVLIPIVYSALLLIEQKGPGAASSAQPFGLLFLFAAIFAQSTMWLLAVGSFVLVYPLVPGRLGVLKGLVAGVFVGLPWLIVQPLHGAETGLYTTYFIPAVLTLLFGAIGLLLDFSTVRRRHEDLKQLGELYSLTRIRAAFVAIPVLLLTFSIIQGLANGHGATALSNAASNLSGNFP